MAGKNPEDVVRRYIQKVKTPPDEVSWHCRGQGVGTEPGVMPMG